MYRLLRPRAGTARTKGVHTPYARYVPLPRVGLSNRLSPTHIERFAPAIGPNRALSAHEDCNKRQV